MVSGERNLSVFLPTDKLTFEFIPCDFNFKTLSVFFLYAPSKIKIIEY